MTGSTKKQQPEPALTYVGIERAVVLGQDIQIEGKVYLLEPDGSLRPINGEELVELDNRYPDFIRNWRL